ncbi:MAG: ABC transporter substrate-binding protein [Phycisphaerales bacterium]|nr:ABC transporter substrate-binding protein [Phycisphaerales bacterium]
MRIISLLPAATEMLGAIGALDLLVGRSHECDWPPRVRSLPALTSQRLDSSAGSAEIDRAVREHLASGAGLYVLDEPQLEALEPDVILTQDLCAVCSIDLRSVERLAATLEPRPAIVSLNPASLEDVFDDLLRVGRAVHRERAAERAVVALRERYFAARDHVNAYEPGPSVVFIEWLDPIFVGGHWTPQLIEAAGARHPLNEPGQPSRVASPDELVALEPDVLIIAPCGADLGWTQRELATVESQPWWRELPAVRTGRIAIVDGSQMFNRPGPRLVDAFEWLVGWLHGIDRLMPRDFPWRPGRDR